MTETKLSELVQRISDLSNQDDSKVQEYKDKLPRELLEKKMYLTKVIEYFMQVNKALHKIRSNTDLSTTSLCTYFEGSNRRLKRLMDEIAYDSPQETTDDQLVVFFLSNLGLGDSINTSAVAHYLTGIVDRVRVCVKDIHVKSMKGFFDSNPHIEIVAVDSKNEEAHIAQLRAEALESKQKILASGCWIEHEKPSWIRNPNVSVPQALYLDMEVPFSIFYDNFYYDMSMKRIAEQMEPIKHLKIVLCHTVPSTDDTSHILQRYIEPCLEDESQIVVDITRNQYPESHPYYPLAQAFVFLPITEYYGIIHAAEKIFVADSSLYCMIIHYKQLPATEMVCALRFGPVSTAMNLDPRFLYLKS